MLLWNLATRYSFEEFEARYDDARPLLFRLSPHRCFLPLHRIHRELTLLGALQEE